MGTIIFILLLILAGIMVEIVLDGLDEQKRTVNRLVDKARQRPSKRPLNRYTKVGLQK